MTESVLHRPGPSRRTVLALAVVALVAAGAGLAVGLALRPEVPPGPPHLAGQLTGPPIDPLPELTSPPSRIADRPVRHARARSAAARLFLASVDAAASEVPAELREAARADVGPRLDALADALLAVVWDDTRFLGAAHLCQDEYARALAEHVRRDHEARVREEVTTRATALARTLAGVWKEELARRVGRPLGESLSAATQGEVNDLARRLADAGGLAAADVTAEDVSALRALAKAVADKAVDPKPDLKAELDQLHKTTARFRAAGGRLAGIVASLKDRYPAAAERAATLRSDGVEVVAEHLTAAVAEVAKGQPAMAAGNLNQAVLRGQDAVADGAAFRAALTCTAARERADAVFRVLSPVADRAWQAAQARNAAARARDLPAEERARHEAVTASYTLTGLATALDLAVTETGKAAEAAKSVGDKGLADAAGRAERARTLVRDARVALTDQKPGDAALTLQKAAAEWEKLADDLGGVARVLGVSDGSFSAALALEADGLRAPAAERAREKLADALKEKVPSLLREQLRAALRKRVRAERLGRDDLADAWAEEVLTQVLAGLPADAETVANEARTRTPAVRADKDRPPAEKPARLTEWRAALTGPTGQAAEREAAAVAEAVARHPAIAELSRPGPPGPGDSLERLDLLQRQLAAGRRDALGPLDRLAVATARRAALEGSESATGVNLSTGSPVPTLLGAPASPHGYRVATAPLLPAGAIVIDGDLADWKDIPRLELRPVGKADARVKVRPEVQSAAVAWSSRGVLVAVEVEDTTGAVEDAGPPNNFWELDALEVFVDTANSRLPRRGDAGCRQFFAFPLGHATDRGTPGYEARAVRGGDGLDWQRLPLDATAMARAGRKTAKGWTLEVLLATPLLRPGVVEAGRTFGFNLQLDTGSAVYYYWSTDGDLKVSERPDAWGDLLLLGTDARLEISPAEIPPGQAISVRVADADRDRDPGRREQLAVTVRAGDGPSTPLILEETDAASGVFVGAAASRPPGSPSVPGVLEVAEGGLLVVEYIDEARSDAVRDVSLRSTCPVRRPKPVAALPTTP